ncbi:hypothetical protein CLPUN_41990 [Clostridium puniceum]|uniref:Uncharacterized protein n=1 Tax=Clostridium puniceum TaxID=29367 RepID=A0A1S8T8N9_9CLOT|nr:hypothetical protein [Clostridium puniceum]OOM73961.1 hypothetical protein CLPUN_41990 [Clostridium puniceum]
MNECKENCICLKCGLHETKSCKYDDCKWCKGKDGITMCQYFAEEVK